MTEADPEPTPAGDTLHAMDGAPEPGESSGLSNLEPELRLTIEGKVDRELAGRAIAGSMAYFLVCVVVAVSTPYYTDHPLAVMLAGGLTLLVGGMRLLSARHLLKHADGDLSGAVRVFYATTYATFIIWGFF